jgi:hypothetical protein
VFYFGVRLQISQSHSVPGQLPIQCLPTECCGSYRDYQERRCSFPFPTFCGSKPRETMPAYTPPAAVTCCGKPWHTCHFPKITRSAMERGHSFDYMQTDKISSLQSTLSTFWYPVESNLRPWNGISPNKSVLRQKSESGGLTENMSSARFPGLMCPMPAQILAR